MKKLQMKKLAASTIVAAVMFAAAMPAAQAATAGPAPFNVQVSLTSVCTIAAIPNMSFGTYTAFGAASIPAPTTSVALTCTRGLAATPTLAFDAAFGVVAGLNYTVSSGAPTTTAGTNATPTAGAPNGTPTTYAIVVTGAMPAGQAGTDSVGVQTDIRTVTITY